MQGDSASAIADRFFTTVQGLQLVNPDMFKIAVRSLPCHPATPRTRACVRVHTDSSTQKVHGLVGVAQPPIPHTFLAHTIRCFCSILVTRPYMPAPLFATTQSIQPPFFLTTQYIPSPYNIPTSQISTQYIPPTRLSIPASPLDLHSSSSVSHHTFLPLLPLFLSPPLVPHFSPPPLVPLSSPPRFAASISPNPQPPGQATRRRLYDHEAVTQISMAG